MARRRNSYLSLNITARQNTEELDKRGNTSRFSWQFVWITRSALLVSTLRLELHPYICYCKYGSGLWYAQSSTLSICP